jgi:hypothetical protein
MMGTPFQSETGWLEGRSKISGSSVGVGGMGVRVGMGVFVEVEVGVGVSVGLEVGVDVSVGAAVLVEVSVGIGVGSAWGTLQAEMSTPIMRMKVI